MFISLHSSDRSPVRIKPNLARAGLLVIVPALAASAPALAGVTHTWDGSANTSWHTAANWNTNAVPAAGDNAHILGGPSNIFLNADSANLASLFLSSGRSLSNNGYSLSVINTVATTTVSGVDSTLFITNSSDPYDFETGWLTVQSNGRLQMSGGGVAMVNAQLTLSSGGRILGNGHVYVHENAPAAFNAANGSDITVSGGDLELAVIGGGSIALAPTINVTNPGLTLYVDAPMFTPVNDINLGNGSAFNSEFNWTLGGTLIANPGSGGLSQIEGNGDVTVDGAITVFANGTLNVAPQIDFESGSTTTMGIGATLELDGPYRSHAGHAMTIGPNATLRLNGTPSIYGWEGDIVSNGGIIESNDLSVSVEGDLTLGSLGSARTRINGTSCVRGLGTVTAPGLGATVNATFDLAGTGVMSLNLATTSIAVNGDMILRDNSTTTGAGFIQVNAGGALRIDNHANVGVEVINAGDVNAGDNTVRAFIDIIGAFDQTETGTLSVDIGPGGGGAVSNDRYAIADDAVLGGTLHVRLASGFTPVEGAEFVILSADSISGTFASLTGAPGFSLSYSEDEVTLQYNGVGLYADVDDDGFVNINDLLEVINAWGVCPPPPAECPADITLDGMVNINDLLEVINHWTS